MQKKEKAEKIKKVVQKVTKKSDEKKKKVKEISKKIKQIVHKIKSGNSSNKQEDLKKIKKYKSFLIDFSSENIAKDMEIDTHDVNIPSISQGDINAIVSEVHGKVDELNGASLSPLENPKDIAQKENVQEHVNKPENSSVDIVSTIAEVSAEAVSEVAKETLKEETGKPETEAKLKVVTSPEVAVSPKIDALLKNDLQDAPPLVNEKKETPQASSEMEKGDKKFSEASKMLKGATVIKVKGDLNNVKKIKIDRAMLEKIKQAKANRR